MQRTVLMTLTLLASLALLPLACIARARLVTSSSPRVHVIPDMDNQGRFKAQQANPIFADRRAMRLPVEGTVARGQLDADDAYHRGVADGAYVERLPVTVSAKTMRRGQERYGIYCSPCHGLAGYGDGMIARRAEELQQGSWVPPVSFHDEPAITRPAGHIFNTISNGIRSMPAYGSAIPVEDRWAIVAYVRALQRSQHAELEDVPRDLRASIASMEESKQQEPVE